jgi:hypothetical protein
VGAETSAFRRFGNNAFVYRPLQQIYEPFVDVTEARNLIVPVARQMRWNGVAMAVVSRTQDSPCRFGGPSSRA